MSSSCTDRAKSLRDDYLNNNKIFLLSGRYCGYCHKAKNLLKQRNIEFLDIDIQNPSNEDLNDELITCFYEKTKSLYIPQVFIESKFIGGYKNLEDYVMKNY
jgi:glutaredoxin 3